MNTSEQIFISNASFNELGHFLSKPFSSCFVLVDENTLKHCYPLVANLLPAHNIIAVLSGEVNKTLDSCRLIWAKLTDAEADRKSLLINLGGGVITDMGGFAAGCYKRGISFINIPTTLLAMVDAGIGGKTGIDFMGFKNQVGLFAQPQAVFIDAAFLATLPQRQLTSGFAEVIKHYLIADKAAFNALEKAPADLTHQPWPDLIYKSIKIKTDIVELDPHEQGARKALNFGHTIGHAVESAFMADETNYLLHGEAVAIGMITESYLSVNKNLLSEEESGRVQKVILKYFNLPRIDTARQTEIMLRIKQDKKNENDTTRFTLLHGIGNYSINNAVEDRLISASLNYYNSLLK